jgi:hypothetical protein
VLFGFGLAHTLAQRLRADAQIVRDVRDRPIAVERDPHTALDQLSGYRFGRDMAGRASPLAGGQPRPSYPDVEEAPNSPGADQAASRGRRGPYLALMGAFNAIVVGGVVAAGRAGRLPERVSPSDLTLGAIATCKVSRLIAKDRVTSGLRAHFTRFQEDSGHGEVEEAARGTGLRRAVGELLVCPNCLAQWMALVVPAASLLRLARRALSPPFSRSMRQPTSCRCFTTRRRASSASEPHRLHDNPSRSRA